MFYGVNERDLARRGATFVDKILKGAETRQPSRRAAAKI